MAEYFYAQFDSWYDIFKDFYKTEFDSWYDIEKTYYYAQFDSWYDIASPFADFCSIYDINTGVDFTTIINLATPLSLQFRTRVDSVTGISSTFEVI